MTAPALTAKLERAGAGRLRVVSPALGCWEHGLRPGAIVERGSFLGRLVQLGRSRALLFPEGPAGRIAEGLPEDRKVPVEHGQVLFEVVPLGSADVAEAPAVEPVAGPGGAEGALRVVSPTDGVFYRAPSPGAPPFVGVGSRVREGEPVGLVEVMKTFSHIVYGGAALPPEAEIVEICCGDAQEVRAGQTLLLVRPTDAEA